MGPLGGDGRSAAILVTTTGIADDELIGFRGQRIVAAMNPFANATGMRCSGGRHREWGEISHESEKQQQFGGLAMHDACVNPNPKGGASIEQNPEWTQAKSCGRSLGPLVKTRAFGTTPGKMEPLDFSRSRYHYARVTSSAHRLRRW
jgi:hypothetical protein